MLTFDQQQQQRDEWVLHHGKAIHDELSKHSPAVQAFMKRNFNLHLYPLNFTADFAAQLTAFEAAARANG